MRYRDQSYRYVEASDDFVVNVSRGNSSRYFEISRGKLIAGGIAAGLVSLATIGAAGYLVFRDDMLASLIARQTSLQYAYEDRIAAMRLRLDQVMSKQFVDQDGVEGKVQNLVLRQARLETRAAAVAQLFERTVARDGASVSFVSPAARAESPPRAAGKAVLMPLGKGSGAVAPLAPAPQRSGLDDNVMSYTGKPEPQETDLRLGAPLEGKPLPLSPPNAAPKHDELTPIDTSFAPGLTQPAASLAHAADPDLPMPSRLESLAMSIDRVEHDQSRRLNGIVRPALEAAGRLRRAFDIAGLPVEKYGAPSKRKALAPAIGGPYVAARSDSLFERDLTAAQNAVETLDGLRRALPTTPLRKPLIGALQITSTFGYRTDPFLGRPALHGGVDMRDVYGTPIHATAGGVVTVAAPTGGYGNMVEVDHGGGLATRYGHLSAILVTPGQQLAPGAVVGRLGSTGRSTGPHLHYEVRIEGEAVDPTRFLKAATALSE